MNVHLRSKDFLLTKRGWTLSPAYDMNPTDTEYQSILITATTNKSDLRLLLDASEDYMIPQKEAETITRQVCTAVQAWKPLAQRLGIAKREIDLFTPVFAKHNNIAE